MKDKSASIYLKNVWIYMVLLGFSVLTNCYASSVKESVESSVTTCEELHGKSTVSEEVDFPLVNEDIESLTTDTSADITESSSNDAEITILSPLVDKDTQTTKAPKLLPTIQKRLNSFKKNLTKTVALVKHKEKEDKKASKNNFILILKNLGFEILNTSLGEEMNPLNTMYENETLSRLANIGDLSRSDVDNLGKVEDVGKREDCNVTVLSHFFCYVTVYHLGILPDIIGGNYEEEELRDLVCSCIEPIYGRLCSSTQIAYVVNVYNEQCSQTNQSEGTEESNELEDSELVE